MSMQMNDDAYTELVGEDIKALKLSMPDSLERRHIIQVLEWSVSMKKKYDSMNAGLEIGKVMGSLKVMTSPFVPEGVVIIGTETESVVLKNFLNQEIK